MEIEEVEEYKEESGPTAKYLIKKLTEAEEEAETFFDIAKDAYKEYTFSETVGSKGQYASDKAKHQHLAIYWSSIQTAKPSVYNQTPTPVAKRRFDDNDPVGRVGAMLIERMSYTMLDTTRFDDVLDRMVENFLVSGRGNARVYYRADLEQVPESMDEFGQIIPAQEIVTSETVEPVWLNYDRLLFTPGCTDWSEVTWVAFEQYFDKKEFKARFGEIVEQRLGENWKEKINFNYNSKRKQKDTGIAEDSECEGEYIKIYELWNKEDKKVYWISPDFKEDFIDVEEDIYGLVNFFPCIEPVQGTLQCDTLHPVPEFVQYRQLLSMIDYLQSRERILIKALRAKGVYDASMPELIRLAREADEADLVGVENFIAMQEKGGLASAIQYVDLSSLAQSLLNLYDAKERKKQELYEITGFSDIMRGATAASESATAQQLKSEFGAVRLREKVKKIAYAAQELLELMVDLALARFQDQTILDMAGAQFFSPEDQQVVPEALAMIREDKLRTFRVEIETDSTVSVYSQVERDGRIEFLNAFSTYAQQVLNVAGAAPELLPAMADAAMYAIRGLKQSSSIESSIESGFEALKQVAQQPPPETPPDPKVEIENAKLQLEQGKGEMQMQLEQAKFTLEQQKVQNQVQLDAAKLEIEREKLALQNERDMLKASLEQEKMKAELALKQAEMALENMRAQYELTLAARGEGQEEKGESEEKPSVVINMPNQTKKVTFADGSTAMVEPLNGI